MIPRVRAVKFTAHTIRAKIDGIPTMARIQVCPYVPMVGHYKKKEPVVLVDRKITDPKERQSLALHELHERYRRYHDHMGPKSAHDLSEREEHHWAVRHGVHWNRYSRNVEHVFRQNHRDGVRRRR